MMRTPPNRASRPTSPANPGALPYQRPGAPNPAPGRPGPYRALALALALALGGCPVRVDPPGPGQCIERATCEQCASQPDCGWCVAAGAHRCFAEGSLPTDCDLAVVVSDLCPPDDRSEPIPATSGN